MTWADTGADVALALALMLGGVLYSSVGHGGASAYIAIMALYGMDSADIKPTALALNIVVAALASYRFLKAGLFDARLFVLVALPAIPAAFLGGYLTLPKALFNPIVGGVLIFAALRFFLPLPSPKLASRSRTDTWAKLMAGGAIGLLSGLTGTGGGIFLSPLVLLAGWTAPKQASGVAALFILCNSAAGLAGNVASLARLPPNLWLLAGAVFMGALIGTTLGLRQFSNRAVSIALALVLLIAGIKFVLT